MANKTNPDNFLSWGKIFGDIKKLIFVSNITMRKSLLRKCFSLSAENIHKCEIIRTYIHVQLEKDVWGRRSCRRHCHTIVHWSCTLLSVRGNISLSFRHPQTDSPIETTTKEKYWCGCLIKQPHIYFTSGETEFKVAWKVSKPRWLNLLCNGDAGNLSFLLFYFTLMAKPMEVIFATLIIALYRVFF